MKLTILKDITVLIRFTYKLSWHFTIPLQPKFIKGSNQQLTPTPNLIEIYFAVCDIKKEPLLSLNYDVFQC